MSKKTSVVTPERFTKGLSYKDFVAQIKVNKDNFEKYYATGQLTAEDAKFFRKASQVPNGIGKMLAIGEPW